MNISRKLNKNLYIYTLFSVICIITTLNTTPLHATDPIIGFNPGRIIEDSVFTNTSSMSIPQIQMFLDNKVPVCDTYGTQTSEFGGGTRAQWAAAHGFSAPFTCLKDYSENGITAAQIIYDISLRYQINPQVLIVLLQKEQGLVTDTWPTSNQYRSATGYGCPDTAPCDSQYYGLTNQITWSGKMFRSVLNDSPTWYSPYILGNNYIKFHPDFWDSANQVWKNTCGGTTVFIQNRATQALYDYTPYQPNQASLDAGYGNGDGCSSYGNKNFYLYFRDWFGYNSGPAAFKTSDTQSIYMPIEGYKLAVPYTAAMQDYGISPESIQTVSQAYVDAIPTPPISTNISASISHVIKSPYDNDEDGASVYLISRGKRYQVQTMQQLYNYGFNDSDISYLPLSYIYSMNNGGLLSNFATSPYGSVFKINNLTKQLIFEYNTYTSLNPSGQVTPLSYYLIDKITSGNPITDRPVLIKNKDSETVSLYQNGTYYAVPDYNIFSCLGFNDSSFVPAYRLQQNNYIASFSTQSNLNCIVSDTQKNYALNGSSKNIIPNDYAIEGSIMSPDISALVSKIPTQTTPLKQYVKSPDNAAVWYIESGKRKLIPSYISFVLLGLNSSNVDIINQNILNQIPTNGIKLATGQLVKDPSSAAIYVISNNTRVLYPSSDLFINYGNSWGDIITYPSADLDLYYPAEGGAVNDYLVNTSLNKAYLVEQSGCYELSNSTLIGLGKDYATLSSNQSYSSEIFKSIDKCTASTNFVKIQNQDLVYWLDAGKKHALYTYTSMLDKNDGAEPKVMNVTPTLLSSIESGVPLY